MRETIQLVDELMIIANKASECLGFKRETNQMSFTSKTQLLSAYHKLYNTEFVKKILIELSDDIYVKDLEFGNWNIIFNAGHFGKVD